MIHSLRFAVVFALGLLVAACGGSPTIPDSPPEAPGSFTAELTPNNEALLRWTAPAPSPDRAPVTGYRVYLESADGLVARIGQTHSLSYRHTGLSPGVRYVFHIRALSDAGLSDPSASAFVDVAPRPSLPPEAPGSFTAELTPNHEALLQWTAPAPSPDRASVTSYRVYLESADGLVVQLGQTQSLSYRHTRLSPGVRYVFHIRAVSDAGLSDPSASAFVDVAPRPSLPPEAPGSFTAELTPNHEALLQWTAPAPSPDRASVTSYRVYLESADGLVVQLGQTQSLSYRHTRLSPGVRYVFHVRAVSDAGLSDPSASAFVDVAPRPSLPPEAPGSFTAELTPNHEALLTWEAPLPDRDRAPVTGYLVYRESAGGLATQIGTTSSLSYRDVGLLPGRIYVYHVRADSREGVSLPSASASVDVRGVAIAPIAVPHLTVRADQGDQRVVISWIHRFEPTLSTAVTDFELQYCDVEPEHLSDHCPPNGVWTTLRTFPAATRAFIDRSVDCDLIDANPMARMYRVRAIASDLSASSPYSDPTRPICPSSGYSPPRRVEALFAVTTHRRKGQYLLGRPRGQRRPGDRLRAAHNA